MIWRGTDPAGIGAATPSAVAMAGAAPSVGTAGAGTPRGMGAAVVVVPVAVGASTNAADAMSPAGIGRAHFVDARELGHQ